MRNFNHTFEVYHSKVTSSFSILTKMEANEARKLVKYCVLYLAAGGIIK